MSPHIPQPKKKKCICNKQFDQRNLNNITAIEAFDNSLDEHIQAAIFLSFEVNINQLWNIII